MDGANIKTSIFKSGISRRLIVSIVIFSTVLTLLITMAQLYRDYRSDISRIKFQMQQIEDVHLRSLSALLWAADEEEIKLLAEGIMHLPDMQYLEIRDKDRTWVKLGKPQTSNIIERVYPVFYDYRGKQRDIGTLTIVATLNGVYNRLFETAVTVLVSNAIKTFLVATFIFFIFHFLMTRHILSIATFYKTLDMTAQPIPYRLDRPGKQSKSADELDFLVDALNEMQIKLHTSMQKLHQSNELYRTLIQYTRAIPWELDVASFRFTYVGQQAVKLLGYPVKDWYEDNFWVDHLHPDDAEYAVSFCTSQTEQGLDHEFEYRVVAADGRTVWIHDDVVVVKQEGKPVKLQGFMFDVTRQKTAELALKQAHDELETKVAERTRDLMYAKNDAERANRAKSEFLSRMSHELRTPMTAVMGFSQLLKEDPQVTDKQSEYISEILSAGNHLLELIEEILDLSRIESGNVELVLKPVNLLPILGESLKLVSNMATEHEIVIDNNLSGLRQCDVLADSKSLKEVILNLLTNAIKYGNPKTRVTVSGFPLDNGCFRLVIADQGNGLNDDEQRKIFEPFERLGADHTNIQGVGIGLSIAKRFIELMGGNIGVKSERGRGSEFFIDLRLPEA